jgi:hypothetical protein
VSERVGLNFAGVADACSLGCHPKAALLVARILRRRGDIQPKDRHHLSNPIETQIAQRTVFQSDQGLARQAAHLSQPGLGQAKGFAPHADRSANAVEVHSDSGTLALKMSDILDILARSAP